MAKLLMLAAITAVICVQISDGVITIDVDEKAESKAYDTVVFPASKWACTPTTLTTYSAGKSILKAYHKEQKIKAGYPLRTIINMKDKSGKICYYLPFSSLSKSTPKAGSAVKVEDVPETKMYRDYASLKTCGKKTAAELQTVLEGQKIADADFTNLISNDYYGIFKKTDCGFYAKAAAAVKPPVKPTTL